MWFQNRRAKFRKQERLAQQKASSNNSSESPGSQSSIKAENNAASKTSSLVGKDVKPGSPHSGISTTPNSNASVSSHQSSNGDVKPMNGTGEFAQTHTSNTLLSESDTFPTPFVLYANSYTSYFRKERSSLSDRTILFLYAEDKSTEHLAGITYARYSFPDGGVEGGGTAAATLTFNLENCPLPLIYFHYCQLFSRRRRSLQEPAILCHIIGKETFLAELS